MLEIHTYVLGPVQTNAYLIGDPNTCQAVVIDPAWNGRLIVEAAEKLSWRLTSIWLTHAHFDHLGGVGVILELVKPPPLVALHPDDRELWRMQGGAPFFGLQVDLGPEPTEELRHGQVLELGIYRFEVRHTPGHTPGHVIFYCADQGLVFCGDVIFNGSIGRTDLPGGDFDTLIDSIQNQIFSLPDETRLLSGHGPETTVGEERRENPFFS
jgi:glyoxylase-like metal-dependent hydrolase (beta-lactamase superfamily II)